MQLNGLNNIIEVKSTFWATKLLEFRRELLVLVLVDSSEDVDFSFELFHLAGNKGSNQTFNKSIQIYYMPSTEI